MPRTRLELYNRHIARAKKLRAEAWKLTEKAIGIEVKAKHVFLDKCPECHGSGHSGYKDDYGSYQSYRCSICQGGGFLLPED